MHSSSKDMGLMWFVDRLNVHLDDKGTVHDVNFG